MNFDEKPVDQRPASDNRDSGVKSAARVLEIFELFCECRTPLSVGEVSKRLGYPQSSTSVLIRSLQKLGYLSFDPVTRCFAPTVRLAVLGGWVNDLLLVSGTITRMMEEVRDRMGLTTLIGLQNGYHVQYAHVVEGKAGLRHYLRIGQLRPIGMAAVGKVLLSLKSDPEIGLLLRRMNAAMADPVQCVDVDRLLAEMGDIRRQGYARSRGAVVPGRDVLAVQLRTPPGTPPLALGVSADTSMIDQEINTILGVLREVTGDYNTMAADEPMPSPEVRRTVWHPQ